MIDAISFADKICALCPPPAQSSGHFTEEDITAFEKAIGAELPSDYYELLKRYGYGSFSDYVYINYPFTKNSAERFIAENAEKKENYDLLEEMFHERLHSEPLSFVDCKFQNGALAVIAGNAELAEFLRAEKIDAYTRSRIITLGNHFPYDFYPEEGGLLFLGYTDDEEFFFRFADGKASIVMYDDGYYEFDMSFTEFLYEYFTQTIKLPMQWEETIGWEFCPYQPQEM